MLKLKHFGLIMISENALEKIRIMGKTEGKGRRGWKRMRWLDSVIKAMNMNTCFGAKQVWICAVAEGYITLSIATLSSQE